MAQRNRVTNDRADPLTLWVEPWGEDYTLLPNEAVEVVVEGFAEGLGVDWCIGEEKILLYVEGDPNAAVSVYQDGTRLECGYQRAVAAAPTPAGPSTSTSSGAR